MKAGFGGGCHWCTEAVFQALRGVRRTEQGFIKSEAPNDSFSEAVIVHFDADIIPLETLIDIHLRTHSSQSDHTLRGKYRSAVYVFDAAQGEDARISLSKLQDEFDRDLVTQVLRFGEFKASDERFQNYYENDPERPFCKTYIDPKLSMLRTRYAAHI